MSLHLVIGTADCGTQQITAIVSQAIQGGVTHVQLREKHATTQEFLTLAKSLQTLLTPQRIPLIINDRVDIALAVNADGVHLGQSDMPYADARRLLGPNKIIGLTVETLAQMHIANQYKLEYIGVGPIFATASKLDAPTPLGMPGLAEIQQFSQHPVIAIGGINLSNAVDILKTGIVGLAVISAITQARDIKIASCKLKQLILRSHQ